MIAKVFGKVDMFWTYHLPFEKEPEHGVVAGAFARKTAGPQNPERIEL
jgi:hypothetical protein